MSMDSSSERWPLSSGVWLRDTASGRWDLALTADHRPISASIPMPDRYRLVGARAKVESPTGQHCVDLRPSGGDGGHLLRAADTLPPAADALRYPPEFHFAPDTGEALAAVPLRESAVWIPPSGAAPVLDPIQQVRESRQLQQAEVGIRLRPAPIGSGPMHAADNATFAMPLPPPGRYEFCAARFGAQQDVLLAIEPERGDLFAWLPLAQLWQPMAPRATGPLADGSLVGERWRMELQQQDSVTTMVMPTVAGLASIKADALTLSYSVTYAGTGPALGSPIFWSGEVWAPVGSSPMSLSLVSQTGKAIPVALPVAVEAFALPVCDARQIVWPCEQGQLVIRQGAGGAPEAAWVEWPQGVTPRFEFGSPYLSRAGVFWQIAWDDATGSYVFVQMGRPNPEVHQASSPSFCTGRVSHRHGHRIKGDPWLDPEHVSDSSSDKVMIPLLESIRNAAVLGLMVETTSGATALLASNERQRAELQYQEDSSPPVRFFTMLVAQPWHTRAFVYDQRLWIYHPDMQVAHGWDLEK